METTDYIAVLALIVSLISAGISVRSWRFNLKVKSLELRALLLASLHNALLKAENIRSDYILCKNEALDAKQIELFKSFKSEQTLEEIIEDLRSDIKEVEAASGYGAVDFYERSIGRITDRSLQINDASNEMASIKTGLIATLLKEKQTRETNGVSS